MFNDLIAIAGLGFVFSALIIYLGASVHSMRSNRLKALIIVVASLVSLPVILVLANYSIRTNRGVFSFETASECTVSQLQLPQIACDITINIDYDGECIRFQAKMRDFAEWHEDMDRFGKLDGIKSNEILSEKYRASDATFFSLFKQTKWSQPRDLVVYDGQPCEVHAWYDADKEYAYIYVARW